MQPQTDPFSDETLSSLQALALPIEPVLRDRFCRRSPSSCGRLSSRPGRAGLVGEDRPRAAARIPRTPARIRAI